jgi:hypothetical protein
LRVVGTASPRMVGEPRRAQLVVLPPPEAAARSVARTSGLLPLLAASAAGPSRSSQPHGSSRPGRGGDGPEFASGDDLTTPDTARARRPSRVPPTSRSDLARIVVVFAAALALHVGRRGFPHIQGRPRRGESAARPARPLDRLGLLRGLKRQSRAQDRRPGPPIGPPHQGGRGLGASPPGRVRPGPRQARGRRALTTQAPQADIHPTNAARPAAPAAHGLGRSIHRPPRDHAPSALPASGRRRQLGSW